ncbi:polymer-forming cytoskeletal protein [Gracilinema caldarium]|uniref:bactofilin family protein n=1 Tax=Gracilinema caldarium TaxID=215591 RepID=UPI0026F07621|nr:polymer-forming cytoskeletal protein [Gracilinema caldarium]
MPEKILENLSINTIIGAGTRIDGDVVSPGFTRIDGALKGDLTVQGRVVIGENARLRSNVSGTAVTVGGVVLGDILAHDRVIVLSSAVVLGTIITCRIQIDEGSIIHGRVITCATREEWERRCAEQRDARSINAPIFRRT